MGGEPTTGEGEEGKEAAERRRGLGTKVSYADQIAACHAFRSHSGAVEKRVAVRAPSGTGAFASA
jgi:hypothetical protein